MAGAGPAGLAAALAVAQAGQRVTVLAPGVGPAGLAPARAIDLRTTAVLGDGIAYLQRLGVWERVAAVSAPLAGIRLIDDRNGWFRAPEVLFRAAETGRVAFGYNIPNAPLVAGLLAAATENAAVTLIETRGVVRAVPSTESVVLETQEGLFFRAKLAIAADGRASVVRAAAGIGTREWSYPQTALVVSFGHSRPHDGISTEFHRAVGPFTTVPLPDDRLGHASSLVWVETPDEAARLMALGDDAFVVAVERRLGGLLGRLHNLGPRAKFPLKGLMATTTGRNRVALIGEAAHVVPPIGAQGLNLGFRDGAALAEALSGLNGDPGDAVVTTRYARARAADLVSREIGIDLLNRALLTNMAPLQAMRGLGLHALANSPTLRRAAVEMGLRPPGPVPALMQPLAEV